MPITFGSVGDIIAVGQIAWSLAQSLSDSRGSAKEYQGLIKELGAFERAVLQVVALWQNYDCPDVSTTDITKDWLDTLRTFQGKVDRKYGRHLAASGSGNWVIDVSKKVLWQTEKADIMELRTKLHSASETLTLLTIAAMGKSTKLAEGEIKFRVRVVHLMLEDVKKRTEEQVTQLKAINAKIEAHSKTSDDILSTIKSGIISLTQLHCITVEIKNTLCLFQSHMRLEKETPRGIGTGWQSDPVTLEDALGFRHTIPLDIVTSWKILDVLLLERFENRHGHQKILKGEFAIEEDKTGKDISRKTQFKMCFRPGQKVDMSMIFSDHDADSNHCPRCQTKSEASVGTRTQCASCHMWFQRLVELDDETNLEPIPELIERPTAAHSSVRTKQAKVVTTTPADFQRVRLMSIVRSQEQQAAEGSTMEPPNHLTNDDVVILESEFSENPSPPLEVKRRFAEDIGVPLATINDWFDKRQVRAKNYRTERDGRGKSYRIERDGRGRERLVRTSSHREEGSHGRARSTRELLNEAEEREQRLNAEILALQTRLSYAQRDNWQYQNIINERLRSSSTENSAASRSIDENVSEGAEVLLAMNKGNVSGSGTDSDSSSPITPPLNDEMSNL
ncbi:uncharacterized protein K444DRAFT_612697 [Hyaloscypha bicolor E]|uniref:Homeobox domain-containing protein n=1 Tax=Hyaloscypha bicolor E TaxID=1095630 RepID=A0A2J6TC21_9HELO|nr:uncharacterized protein K444DRAFT_612697 [Hyaloscypha bicolor E]PMD60566.1 hypothetical protein K444DRAFT_612697 [Hyaloscypha bicolor E]